MIRKRNGIRVQDAMYGLGLLLGLLGLVAARASQAAPAPCPTESDEFGEFHVCTLEVGDTEVAVFVDDVNNDLLIADWRVGGVSQLALAGFTFRDFTTAGTPETALQAATVDPVANEIYVEFSAVGGPMTASVTFRVAHTGFTSTIEETISLTATSNIQARAYAVTDFDLGGDGLDDLAFAENTGELIIQQDDLVVGRIEVVSGPAATGWEVGVCCDLQDGLLFEGQTFPLSNNLTIPGPEDYEVAMSWNATVGPSAPFSVTVEKTIAVPEPGAGAASLGVLAALLALRRKGSTGGAARRAGAAAS